MTFSDLRIFAGAAVAALFVTACGAEPETRAQTAPERSDIAAGGAYMVAAADPRATEAGLAMLARGGSAADAAVAVEAVLSLVEPQSSGLGGGAFVLYHDASSGALLTFDGRETAPASAQPDMFLNANGQPLSFGEAVFGGRSVGVPGVIAALGDAHAAHGRLPWAELFEPALTLAENGFAISHRVNMFLERVPNMVDVPATRGHYYDAAGVAYPVGYVLKNPAYADFLRELASGGPDAYYRGDIARNIIDAVAAAPAAAATMTLDDFRSYEARERAPVCLDYRAYTVCGMGPPSSGPLTILQALAMLERFDIPSMAPHSADALHLYFEAMRLAFADRNRFVGDPDHVEVPTTGMLNKDYLAERSALIDEARALERVAPGAPERFETTRGGRLDYADDASAEVPSTTHFAIRDAFGNAVSVTATIEAPFGSRLMANGFMLNNQLTDFSFASEADGRPIANAVAPGKRPRSSTSPLIIFDENGDFFAAVGSAGGSRIIGYVGKTVIALIDWEMSMQDAIDLPNAVLRGGRPQIEAGGVDQAVFDELRGRGHDLSWFDYPSGTQGVRLTEAGLDGGADKRREGSVGEGRLTSSPE